MSFLLETAIKISLVTGLGLCCSCCFCEAVGRAEALDAGSDDAAGAGDSLLMRVAPSLSLPVPVVRDWASSQAWAAVTRERASRVGVTTTLLAGPTTLRIAGARPNARPAGD